MGSDCLSFILFFVLIHSVFSDKLSYMQNDNVTSCLQRLMSAVTRDTSTVIVYEESHDYLASVISFMAESNHPMYMYDYSSFYDFFGHYMKKVLEYGSLEEYRSSLNFIVLCGTECIEDLIKHVTELDNSLGVGSLLRHFSTWMIISHDPPPHLNTTLDNVAFLTFSQKHLYMDLHPFYRTLQRFQTYTKLVKKSRNQLITEIFTLLWKRTGREWSSVKVHDLSHDQLYISLFPNIRRGLNGRQLRLATLEWPAYAERTISNGTVSYSGASFDVMDLLKRKFNFSYVIVEPEDMLWGQEQKDGTCTGVLGMIKRAEVDMCPVPYGISMTRRRIMDFTSSVTTSEYKVVYRRRPNDSHSWLYLLSCFSWQVYLCGLASLIWLVLLLFGIENQKVQLTSSWKRNLSKCLQIGFHVPLRQAISILPESPSARFLTCTWCIVCLIITGIYTGNLVALSTVDKYEPPFTTLQELAENDEYAVGVLEGAYAEDILMNTDNPTLKSIYKKVTMSMQKSKHNWANENVVADHIQRVLDEKYVLIETDSIRDIASSMACEIGVMKEILNPLHGAYAFPRNSPLVKLFDSHVLFLREIGIINRLKMDWTPKPLICESSMHIPKLDLKSIKTLMLTCAAGILLASFVLCFEMRKKK